MNYAWMCPIVLEKALKKDPTLIGTFSPSGDSMIYVDKTRPPRHQREARLQRIGAGLLQMGSGDVGISEPGPGRDLGPAQPGSFGERRIWPLHRAEGRRRLATSSRARRWHELVENIKKRVKKYAEPIGNMADRRRLREEPEGDDRRASTASPEAARTSISTAASGRSSCSSTARPRRRPARQPDHVPDQRQGPVLRGAADRRQSRHQGRPGDQRQRPGARRASASRSPASTASATASPRPRRAPIGPAARRSGRSWPSPISPPMRPSRERRSDARQGRREINSHGEEDSTWHWRRRP